ncbi:L-fucose:H+ symporter permease [Sphingomonas sp. ASY06-1R]|jgi:FHS family L-fucose permease-like MFS transporter|uniref:L-fucose:H+ symporter permease n=1 Tax=Sphingomonas sp. ASY06-1R TaxID=3445771 RepID=UPI003FA30022
MMQEPPASPGGSQAQQFVIPAYRWGFVLVVSLFFLWAIANNFNDILIRQFQKALGVDRAQAGFVQFVFYIGYFVMALPAGLLMRQLGYRAGIICGLMLYAMGALLFLPASYALSYGAFLAALFVLASGAAFLETAAAAYIGAFGSSGTAVQRLNLAQAFNGLGGFLAPIVGGLFIFSGVEHSAGTLAAMTSADLAAYRATEGTTVRLPYLLLALTAMAVALAVTKARLPKAIVPNDAALGTQFARLARHRPLIGAVVAQFFYVGAQVGIWSYFIDYTKSVAPQLSEREAAFLLSASLVLFMVGRFLGTLLMARWRPVSLLGIYAVINVALCAGAATGHGLPALAALILTSFFMSIMFPTIFALGVADLDADRPLASSCIIMAVIGGAIFPPLMGLVSVRLASVPVSLLLPLGCFMVVAIYAGMARRSVVLPDAYA